MRSGGRTPVAALAFCLLAGGWADAAEAQGAPRPFYRSPYSNHMLFRQGIPPAPVPETTPEQSAWNPVPPTAPAPAAYPPPQAYAPPQRAADPASRIYVPPPPVYAPAPEAPMPVYTPPPAPPAPPGASQETLSPNIQYAHRWPPEGRFYEPPIAAVHFDTGYRRDNFDWNIASDPTGAQTPNVLSELSWRDLQMYQLRGQGEFTVPYGVFRNVHTEAYGSYGWIFSGKNQDSDYEGDNRTQEFSRSNNKADQGNAQALSAALGYAVDLGEYLYAPEAHAETVVTPLFGYAQRKLNLHMTDGFQTVSEPAFGETDTSPLGPFPGLDSTYDAKFAGPFLGMKAEGAYAGHRLGLRGEYHRAHYQGEANWNLRDDFAHPISFAHKADAQGVVTALEYGYAFQPDLELTLRASYETWDTDPGDDLTFFNDSTYSVTRLNEVNWDSQAYHVGIAYRW